MHYIRSLSSQAAAAFDFFTGIDSIATLSDAALKAKKAVVDRAFWFVAGVGVASGAIAGREVILGTDLVTNQYRGDRAGLVATATSIAFAAAVAAGRLHQISEEMDLVLQRRELARHPEALSLRDLLEWNLLDQLPVKALQARFQKIKGEALKRGDPRDFFYQWANDMPRLLSAGAVGVEDCIYPTYEIDLKMTPHAEIALCFPIRKELFSSEAFAALKAEEQEASNRQQNLYDQVFSASYIYRQREMVSRSHQMEDLYWEKHPEREAQARQQQTAYGETLDKILDV